MNLFKHIRNMNTVDVIALLFYITGLYYYFFTDNPSATLMWSILALFFFGIGFIVDAIKDNGTNIYIVTADASSIHVSGKATIQE